MPGEVQGLSGYQVSVQTWKSGDTSSDNCYWNIAKNRLKTKYTATGKTGEPTNAEIAKLTNEMMELNKNAAAGVQRENEILMTGEDVLVPIEFAIYDIKAEMTSAQDSYDSALKAFSDSQSFVAEKLGDLKRAAATYKKDHNDEDAMAARDAAYDAYIKAMNDMEKKKQDADDKLKHMNDLKDELESLQDEYEGSETDIKEALKDTELENSKLQGQIDAKQKELDEAIEKAKKLEEQADKLAYSEEDNSGNVSIKSYEGKEYGKKPTSDSINKAFEEITTGENAIQPSSRGVNVVGDNEETNYNQLTAIENILPDVDKLELKEGSSNEYTYNKDGWEYNAQVKWNKDTETWDVYEKPAAFDEYSESPTGSFNPATLKYTDASGEEKDISAESKLKRYLNHVLKNYTNFDGLVTVDKVIKEEDGTYSYRFVQQLEDGTTLNLTATADSSGNNISVKQKMYDAKGNIIDNDAKNMVYTYTVNDDGTAKQTVTDKNGNTIKEFGYENARIQKEGRTEIVDLPFSTNNTAKPEQNSRYDKAIDNFKKYGDSSILLNSAVAYPDLLNIVKYYDDTNGEGAFKEDVLSLYFKEDEIDGYAEIFGYYNDEAISDTKKTDKENKQNKKYDNIVSKFKNYGDSSILLNSAMTYPDLTDIVKYYDDINGDGAFKRDVLSLYFKEGEELNSYAEIFGYYS